MMFELTQRRALVTGASGGIGTAIASTLIAQGASVALSGTREHALADLVSQLGAKAVSLPADFTDRDAVEGLIGRAMEALGGLDILVNNAGITRDNLALRMKDDEWSEVISVNLDAYFRLSRVALRGMMKQRFGRIINMTSIVGVTGNAGQANYAASKAAIIGMSKSLAQEIASRGVTVNCIAPGFIDTPMTQALSEEQKEKIAAGIPAQRLGSGDDIAACVAFLASDQAAYITGQTLHVNGGMLMV
jgi:3-oxoacyl-[acyl-carrier protein] reductase